MTPPSSRKRSATMVGAVVAAITVGAAPACNGIVGNDDVTLAGGDAGRDGFTRVDAPVADHATADHEVATGDAFVADNSVADTFVPDTFVPDTFVADGFSCDTTKEPKDTPCLVDDAYGVFVAGTGDDTQAGTKAAPLATIQAALALAYTSHKRVYVCAGAVGMPYSESVAYGVANDGVNVYGGFACPTGGASDWSYTGALSTVVSPVGGAAALSIQALALGATFEDLSFSSGDATTPGASAIAAFVATSSNVVFRRVTMRAGDGAAGAPGSMGAMGSNGSGGTSPSGKTGGAATSCTCADGEQTQGGAGETYQGGAATAGLPALGGGFPGTVVGVNCSIGGNGLTGAAGHGGAGASTFGVLLATGWSPASGGASSGGSVGQGGGGGSDDPFVTPPVGGGGGGCGGCPGAGAGVATGGGASFALLAFQSAITLDTCQLSSGMGGAGGPGGNGGPAGIGAAGGFGGSGCNGGNGGAGGPGAGGGGGAGGLSAAIAYDTATGLPSLPGNSSTLLPGKPGSGGAPGSGGSPVPTKGIDGVAANTQAL